MKISRIFIILVFSDFVLYFFISYIISFFKKRYFEKCSNVVILHFDKVLHLRLFNLNAKNKVQ